MENVFDEAPEVFFEFEREAYETLREYCENGSYERAVSLLERAVAEKDTDTVDIMQRLYVLGICYLYGIEVEENEKTALLWLERAAELGYAKAQFELGDCYYLGFGVEEDLDKAVYWYTRSAENGFGAAQYKLAVLFKLGQGVEESPEKAFCWFEKAAEQGDLDAQIEVGVCYEKGIGVEKNRIKAIAWLERAAAQDDKYAEEICSCLKNGSVLDVEIIKLKRELDIFARNLEDFEERMEI